MRLKQRLELQQATESQDATTGELKPSWSTYRDTFGNVTDKAGREQLRGDGSTAVVNAVVTIRYPKQGRVPTSSDRVVYGEDSNTSRTLNIVAVRRKDGDRRWLELDCREAVE